MRVRVYQFGDFRLDCDRFELRRGGHSLRLERKPMELLILLAAKQGDLVTRAEIAERLWEPEVFVDTEHGINTAIRKIRQALRDDSEQPKFVQTVLGKGYRFIGEIATEEVAEGRSAEAAAPASGMAAVEFPEPVPAEEVEERVVPERLVPEEMRRAWQRAGRREGRRGVWWFVGVAAVVVAGVVILVGTRRRAAEMEPIRSLAVLPLSNLSGEPDQDYVAAGMTDELITMLAKDSTLRVTSRTSVMQYKDAHRPLPEIARELGVDALLEGSVSRSGDKTHMTIQLIRAKTDAHIWAESYDRDANGLALLPSEAAEAIASRLKSGVPRVSEPRYVSPESHDAYMRGRYLWFTDHTRAAGPYFKRATELQPDYALGWSGLSMYYGASSVKGELSPEESFRKMDEASSRALALDDTLPEAHLAAAGAEMGVRWNLQRAEAECVRAEALDPKFAEAFHLHAKILAAMNRHAEAIAVQRKATELDPFSRPWAMALALMEARKLDEALKNANEQLVVYPNNSILVGLIHEIDERKGMTRESVEMLAKALEIEGYGGEAEAVRKAFSEGGYKAVLRWKMERVQQRAKRGYVSPVETASLAAKLGDHEGAMAMLEEGYRQHATQLLWMQDDPAFDSLHGDERYRAIVRGVGLPAAY